MIELWHSLQDPAFIQQLISYILMTGGVFFVFTGALGLIRFPDFYTRLHAAALIDSIGLPLLLAGIALLFPLGLITAKIGVLIVFSLIASPTACHALAKAALISGIRPQGEIEEVPPHA